MTEPRKLRLLACQPTVPPTPDAAARDAHVARLADWLDRELAAEGADLAVLPELSTIDYSRESFARLDALAETPDGPSFRAFGALARRRSVAVSFGFPRRAADGFRICQAILGPDGTVLALYDKIHLAQYGASMEKEYFRRGSHVAVVEIAGIRVAPIICYDIRIPELCRALALEQGAGLILHAGAYYRDESFASWPAFAVTRAMENQIYLLSLNRAGAEYGGSMFCPPWVDESVEVRVFPAHDAACRWLVVDPAEIARVRAGYSFLVDRLPAYRP
jgi:nitrilase